MSKSSKGGNGGKGNPKATRKDAGRKAEDEREETLQAVVWDLTSMKT